MKFEISYFAQMRNFKPNMIPISTAYWSPKWFTQNGRVFYDKNHVINGLEYKRFAPELDDTHSCPCQYKGQERDCPFKEFYYKHLVSIPFEVVLKDFQKLEDFLVNKENMCKDDIIFVLMVYEKYDNPCSERSMLQRYFALNGYDLPEVQYPIR